jgi:hypothetical protein
MFNAQHWPNPHKITIDQVSQGRILKVCVTSGCSDHLSVTVPGNVGEPTEDTGAQGHAREIRVSASHPVLDPRLRR